MSKPLFKSSNQPKQATFHVKKGEEVVIISGASRGARGKVLKINRNNNRVLIEGVNMIKKATRPSQENPQGAITELEGSIHISNLMTAEAFAKRKSAVPAAAAKKAKAD